MLFFANVQYSKDDIMDSYYPCPVLKLASVERASGMEAVKNRCLHDQGIQSFELCPFYYIRGRNSIFLIKHLKLLVSLTLKYLKYFPPNKSQGIISMLLLILFLKLEYNILQNIPQKRMKYQYSITAPARTLFAKQQPYVKNE